MILGPTGTGKSDLALRLAQRLDGEIIGCDSLQVYRGFDAGTAKPSVADRRRVQHHLVDRFDPRQACSLAEFVDLAQRAIEEIADRRHVPLIVGGTGLYLRGLLRGVIANAPRNAALRGRLTGMLERHGPARLHRWLVGLDRGSAARLGPGDSQRIVRALEIALSGDQTWSERLRRQGTWATGHERFRSLKIGLDMDRETLGQRLDLRVDQFFGRGLAEEVQHWLRQGVPAEANAFKAIGYREIVAALREGRSAEQARETIKHNTRRYAKRQRTWFRREPGVVWLNALADSEQLAEQVMALWRRVQS